jgi:hypothetical protein
MSWGTSRLSKQLTQRARLPRKPYSLGHHRILNLLQWGRPRRTYMKGVARVLKVGHRFGMSKRF